MRVRVSFTGRRVPRADRFPHTTPFSTPPPPRLFKWNCLFFVFISHLESGSHCPSRRWAGAGGAGKEGKETEGRDTSSLRPLLPRHRRSPNWRGTGFSSASRLHNPPLPAACAGWEVGESGDAAQAPLGVGGGGPGEWGAGRRKDPICFPARSEWL